MNGQDVRVWHKGRLLAIVNVRSRSTYGASVEIKQALGAKDASFDIAAYYHAQAYRFNVEF